MLTIHKRRKMVNLLIYLCFIVYNGAKIIKILMF